MKAMKSANAWDFDIFKVPRSLHRHLTYNLYNECRLHAHQPLFFRLVVQNDWFHFNKLKIWKSGNAIL